jgi:hypothetical protein
MDKKQRRETYVTMKIEKVRLVPEEAVLGGCKTESAGQTGQGQTGNCETASCVSNATS